MKIVLDNIIFSLQKSGGISVVWSELINKLLQKKADEISYFNFNNYTENLFSKHINYHKNQVNFKKYLFLKLQRYLSPKHNFNEKFIFCSSYYRTSYNKNAINITIVHDFTYEYFQKGLSRYIHLHQKKKALENSEAIICISENTKKDMLKFHPHLAKKKIIVIHNGASVEFRRLSDEEIRNEIQSHFAGIAKKKNILFVGDRSDYKNFKMAICSFEKLHDSSFHFVIIGKPLSAAESSFILEHISTSQFTIYSGINNVQLNYIYNCAFVLLYPSSYEGFGIPIVEAMKTALPFIAGKNSSIVEVAGDAGILLEELNIENITKAIKCLESPDIRNLIVKKGLERSELFTWDITMDRYYDFFTDIFNEIN